MSIDVMRMLQLATHAQNISRIEMRVADEVAHYLLNKKRKEITLLEETGSTLVSVTGIQGAAPETLEFTCYDNNNNEVKFLPHEDTDMRRREFSRARSQDLWFGGRIVNPSSDATRRRLRLH